MFIIVAAIIGIGGIFGIPYIHEMIKQRGFISTILFIIALPLWLMTMKTLFNIVGIFFRYPQLRNNLLEYFNVIGIFPFILISLLILCIASSFAIGNIYYKKYQTSNRSEQETQ